MAQYDTGLDILNAVLRRGGEMLPTSTDPTGTDHLVDAKLAIQKAYWELCALKPWRWARKRVQFVSTAQRDVTVNSIAGTAVVLSAVVTPSVAGRKIFLNNDGIPNRIAAHTIGTDTLTLEASYTGSSTSGGAVIYLDEITVAADILSFPHITELHFGDEITVIPEGEALNEFPRNIYGAPRAQYATFITDSIIRLMPWTNEARLFECAYNYRPDPLDFSGTGSPDTPILPRDSRVAIVQRALEMLYSDKRDGRLQVVQGELRETLGKMGSSDSTFSKPRIHLPRGFRVAP